MLPGSPWWVQFGKICSATTVPELSPTQVTQLFLLPQFKSLKIAIRRFNQFWKYLRITGKLWVQSATAFIFTVKTSDASQDDTWSTLKRKKQLRTRSRVACSLQNWQVTLRINWQSLKINGFFCSFCTSMMSWLKLIVNLGRTWWPNGERQKVEFTATSSCRASRSADTDLKLCKSRHSKTHQTGFGCARLQQNSSRRTSGQKSNPNHGV